MSLKFYSIVAAFSIATAIATGAKFLNSHTDLSGSPKTPPKVTGTDISGSPQAIDDYLAKVQHSLEESETEISKFRDRMEKLDKKSEDYQVMNQKVDRLERNLTQTQIEAQALRQAGKDTWEEQRGRLEVSLDRLLSDLNEPVQKPAE
jgi:TolA-binding protein